MFQAMYLRGFKKKLFAFLKCSLIIFHQELEKKRNKKIFEHWMTIQKGRKNMTANQKKFTWMTGKTRLFPV